MNVHAIGLDEAVVKESKKQLDEFLEKLAPE